MMKFVGKGSIEGTIYDLSKLKLNQAVLIGGPNQDLSVEEYLNTFDNRTSSSKLINHIPINGNSVPQEIPYGIIHKGLNNYFFSEFSELSLYREKDIITSDGVLNTVIVPIKDFDNVLPFNLFQKPSNYGPFSVNLLSNVRYVLGLPQFIIDEKYSLGYQEASFIIE